MDGTIIRRARKRYECAGDGRAGHPEHAEGCARAIEPGDDYVEYLGESPAYQSGSRHTMACGHAYYEVGPQTPGYRPRLYGAER